MVMVHLGLSLARASELYWLTHERATDELVLGQLAEARRLIEFWNAKARVLILREVLA